MQQQSQVMEESHCRLQCFAERRQPKETVVASSRQDDAGATGTLQNNGIIQEKRSARNQPVNLYAKKVQRMQEFFVRQSSRLRMHSQNQPPNLPKGT